MKRSVRLLLLSVLIAFTMLFSACAANGQTAQQSGAEASVSATPEPTKEPLPKLGLSLAEDTAFTRVYAKKAAELAVQKGYELVTLNCAGDAAKQKEDITALIAQDAKALIIQPADVDALTYTLDDCDVQGIDVINIMESMNGVVDCLIAPDYALVGQKGARLAAEAKKDKTLDRADAYMLEGAVDSFTMQMMHDGFVSEAAGLEVTIAGAEHFDAVTNEAAKAFPAADVAKANIFFAQSSEIALAVLGKLPEGAELIAVGGDKDILQKVKDSQIYAAVLYGPQELAEKSIEQAASCAADAAYEPPDFIELSLGVASASTIDRYMQTEEEHAEPINE